MSFTECVIRTQQFRYVASKWPQWHIMTDAERSKCEATAMQTTRYIVRYMRYSQMCHHMVCALVSILLSIKLSPFGKQYRLLIASNKKKKRRKINITHLHRQCGLLFAIFSGFRNWKIVFKEIRNKIKGADEFWIYQLSIEIRSAFFFSNNK